MKPGAAELWGWGFGLRTEGVKNQIICSGNQSRTSVEGWPLWEKTFCYECFCKHGTQILWGTLFEAISMFFNWLWKRKWGDFFCCCKDTSGGKTRTGREGWGEGSVHALSSPVGTQLRRWWLFFPTAVRLSLSSQECTAEKAGLLGLLCKLYPLVASLGVVALLEHRREHTNKMEEMHTHTLHNDRLTKPFTLHNLIISNHQWRKCYAGHTPAPKSSGAHFTRVNCRP